MSHASSGGGLGGVKQHRKTSLPRGQLESNTTMSIDFPKEEERVLARWTEIGAFLRQVELVGHFWCFG
jgi:hypothetical protein